MNPFTQRAEVDPLASRARCQAMWSTAVGRARGRADLRTEYQDILDHGDEQLRAAGAEVDRLRVRRDDAAKTHGELVEAVQDLSTKEEALQSGADGGC